MKDLKNRLKQSKIISVIINCVMILFFFILDHVLIKKKKQILFVSFTGRQYSDSPKEIYLSMKQDERFNDYQFKWAFIHPEDFKEIPENEKISMNSFKYFITLFSSQVWISNASLERLIPYKSKKIIYINTWHGIPLKYIGSDEINVDPMVKHWYENMQADLITACSDYDRNIFQRVFPKAKNIECVGLPRNDELYENQKQWTYPTHRPLKVLYAPTFRKEDNDLSVIRKMEYLQSILNVEFYVRMHYFESPVSTTLKDVSKQSLNNLLLEVDMLITDYSSMMFDFSILEKPVLLYPYDLEKYKSERGMYLNIEKLPWMQIYSCDDLEDWLNYLPNNVQLECNKSKQVKQQYQPNSDTQGCATKFILNYIKEKEKN